MKRNYGIDFLRLLSMFMVVMLHVLGQGGVLGAAENGGVKYWIVWFLEIASYSAVNCFALISGYVMYRSNARLSKALNLWAQVAFYTIGAAVAVFILKPEVIGWGAVADAIFPVSRTHYWYISAYFGLLLLQPLLNLMISHAEKRMLGTILLTVFVFLAAFPTFLRSDPYLMGGGYSTIWLVVLYLTGAYIHKYEVTEKMKKSAGWLIFGISLLATFGFTMGMEYLPEGISKVFHYALLAYTSPTVVLMALGLLIALSKQSFGKISAGIISWCAPAALGVYLIHTNKLVWKYLLKGFSVSFAGHHWAVMVLLIFATALAIYAVCILMEKLRIWLFQLVKLDRLCQKAEQWIEKLLNKFVPV